MKFLRKKIHKSNPIILLPGLFIVLVGIIAGSFFLKQKLSTDPREQAYYLNGDPRFNNSPSASGSFGVALATWSTEHGNGLNDELYCYNKYGQEIPCSQEPRKHMLPHRAEMKMKSYYNPDYGFNGTAFNVTSPYYLDGYANTQYISFHFMEPDDRIPLQSNAPGQIMAKFQDQYLSLVEIDGSYIWQRDKFKQWLVDHSDFNDGWGNWYAFYLIAEPDTTSWCKLRAEDYAKVVMDYVELLDEVKQETGVSPRIILASPYIGTITASRKNVSLNSADNLVIDDINIKLPGDRYPAHLQDTYNDSKKVYHNEYFKDVMTHLKQDYSQAQYQKFDSMFTYTSIDIFFGPVPGPDEEVNYQGQTYAAVSDEELKKMAQKTVDVIGAAGNFFKNLTGKDTVIPQFGPIVPSAHHDRPWLSNSRCDWCKDFSDNWETTEWGTARLTQLITHKLATSVDDTHVLAWAYWGLVKQPEWQEPFASTERLKHWGGINHGLMWLAWDILVSPDNIKQYAFNADGSSQHGLKPTNRLWPSRVGMVYLHEANGEYCFRDPAAPDWWPESCSLN